MQKIRFEHLARLCSLINIQRSEIVYCLIVLAVIIVHFYLITTYSINLPFSDDFDQQLARLRNYEIGVWNLWQFLFEQHNEHRITTTHLLTLLSYWWLGEVNIRIQVIIASVILVALVVSFALLVKAEVRLKVLAITACFFLLPNPSSVWLGGSMQYYTVVLFGVLSLYFLRNLHRPFHFFASITCFYLAMFSMASGIVMIFPALLMLVVERKATVLVKLIWVSLAALCLIVFFNGYQTFDNKPSIFYSLTNPVFAIQYFLLILGNPFFGIELGRVVQLASAFLIGVLVVQAVRLKTKSDILYETSAYVALYLIGIVTLVVAGRVGFEEWETALSSRYQIYVKSFWVAALILLINLKLFNLKVLTGLTVCAFVYFGLGSMKSARVLEYNQEQLSIGVTELVFGGNSAYIEYGSLSANIRTANTLKTMMTLHLYHPEFVTSKPSAWEGPVKTETDPTINVSDLRFNQYRRFTIFGNIGQSPVVRLSSVNDREGEFSYLARRIRGLDKYEVLVDEHEVVLPEPIMISVIDDNGMVSELVSERPVRLAGSMIEYAKREP